MARQAERDTGRLAGGRAARSRRAVAVMALLGLAAAAGSGIGARPVAAGAAFDPGPYRDLLVAYLRVVPVADDVFETRFDYAALLASPDRDARLQAVMTAIEGADPAAMTPGEHLAFAINAYNATIIDLVIEHERKAGGAPIRNMMEAAGGNGMIYDEPRLVVAGRPYSANTWERQQVFHEPSGPGASPPGADPRAHFALNCGSLGCPSLLPEVYAAEPLDAQLAQAARNALRNPRHLRIDATAGEVHGSQLFDWYASDFAATGGVMAFVRAYAPPAVIAFIDAHGVTEIIADLPWDWQLNQAAQPARSARPLHTFSIVARDPLTGQLGVAVQSHWFSVGPIVPWAEAGVGAVATQSMVEVSYGPLGLDLMRAGKSAPQALAALLAADSLAAVRQVAMVDAAGRVAAHTGARCIAAAGHQTGVSQLGEGGGYSVEANLMANDTVWPAMARAYEQAEHEAAAAGEGGGGVEDRSSAATSSAAAAPLDFAERLLRALDAGQAAGGDIRGRQSAAILVVAGESSGRPWADRLVDLRVEDAPQPLVELRRLLELHRAYTYMNRGDELIAQDEVEEARAAYAAAAAMAPQVVELPYWEAVTLAGAGRLDEALPIFRDVFAREPIWAELTPRLVPSGFLPDDPDLLARILAEAPAAPEK